MANLNSHLRKGVDYPGITVVYFCHDGNGNHIMAKRSVNSRDEHGCWDIGGGGVELYETIDQTIRQEIMQEYCTAVLGYEYLGYRDVHRSLSDGTKTHWVALDFKVLVNPSGFRNGEPHKFDEIGWFTLDAMPEKVHSQFPKFLELYGDRLK